MSSIPDNSLPPNINALAIMNVPITEISPEAFSNSSNTFQDLFLDNVTYHELPQALLTVRNLTDLKISNTPINNWDISVLQHINKTVYQVGFSNVGLTIWPAWLSYFTLATSVELSMSSLSSIPVDALIKMPNLTTLTVTENQLKDAKNLLDALSPVASRLKELYIGSNNFSSIPAGLAAMSALTSLHIFKNQIQEITGDRIPLQLRYLDISYNLIKELTDTSFPNSSLLHTLILDGNPLTHISKLAFQPLHNLQELSLRSTQLMKIPAALTTLKNVNVLKLDFIDQLHCDCPRDDQIVQWYQSQKNITVSRRCYEHYFDVSLYFRNDTYKRLCSRHDRFEGSISFLIMIFVATYLVNI